MPKNLSQIAKQKKIKYFLISFVDLFGVLRSKLVPAQAIGEMQKKWSWLCWVCYMVRHDTCRQ
jgi:glutamine synthetase